MKIIECAHEDDVLAAVNTGRWPERAEQELRAHVAGCAICQDVVSVAAAFLDSDAEDARSPRLPESSYVWLRAQVRAREEATRLAARPITVAQAVAFASIVGVLGAVAGATSSWLQAGAHWLSATALRFDPRGWTVPASLTAVAADHQLLIAAVGTCLLLLPIGIYFAIRDPRT